MKSADDRIVRVHRGERELEEPAGSDDVRILSPRNKSRALVKEKCGRQAISVSRKLNFALRNSRTCVNVRILFSKLLLDFNENNADDRIRTCVSTKLTGIAV